MSLSGRFFSALAALTLLSCGSGQGDRSCSPAPQISSTPPASAVIDQPYVYTVDARYMCRDFLSYCKDIDGIQLPDGAEIDHINHRITWTPKSGQAELFTIATRPDACGDRVTQSWTVHVSAP